VLAGRDLEAGGTWLGVSREQRFAALTNYREGGKQSVGARSRGALVADFLSGKTPGRLPGAGRGDRSRLQRLQPLRRRWRTTSATTATAATARCAGCSLASTASPTTCSTPPGPSWRAPKRAFAAALSGLPAAAPFFDLLADQEIVADAHLPETGVPLDWERILSAVFVRSENYGTRASTLLLRRRDGLTHADRTQLRCQRHRSSAKFASAFSPR
jgi:hypothetical protein